MRFGQQLGLPVAVPGNYSHGLILIRKPLLMVGRIRCSTNASKLWYIVVPGQGGSS